jgi:hypothetical protein
MVKPHVGIDHSLLIAAKKPSKVLKKRPVVFVGNLGARRPGQGQRIGGTLHQLKMKVPAIPQC